jgi:poly(hydroxyalkanoate) depolymerase family esterase
LSKTHPQSHRLTEIARYGSNPGALKAWLFLPSIMPPDSPLVVALHGCTQDAEGYASGSGWSQLAERQGFAVLYPEQQRSNNANLCYNWFEPEDFRRDRGEAASIGQMIRHVVESQGVDPKRIYITGLSAGGAMANAMLAAYPELFAGGAIIGGLPFGVASNVAEAFERMQGRSPPDAARLQSTLKGASANRQAWPAISIWHGTHDQTVRPANAEQLAVQWSGVHDLPPAPDRSIESGKISRRVWMSPEGREILEINLVRGMGHGVPLATRSDAAVGAPAPYMLETGISSTLRIARSWGLATDADVEKGEVAQTVHDEPRAKKVNAILERTLRQNQCPANDGGKVEESRVARVINDALRAAGLMR